MASVRKLAIATTVATFLLIAVGASVRASGAGLGCPDWPKCYGSWMPPLEPGDAAAEGYDPAEVNVAKAWIEYVNRVVGIIIGFLILGTAVMTWRRFHPDSSAVRRDVTWSATGAALLTAFQGWQGGRVVLEELPAVMITVHLVTALLIVGLLLRVVVGCIRPAGLVKPAAGAASAWTLGALAIVMIQVVLGAIVRGGVDEAAKRMPDAPRAEWLVEAGAMHDVHRTLASLVVIAVAFAWRAVLPATGLQGRVSAFNAIMVAAQLGAGVALAWFSLPPLFQVAHVLLASLLAGGLYLQFLLIRR